MLSQGGEFAFVLLSLASSLHILPDDLNKVRAGRLRLFWTTSLGSSG